MPAPHLLTPCPQLCHCSRGVDPSLRSLGNGAFPSLHFPLSPAPFLFADLITTRHVIGFYVPHVEYKHLEDSDFIVLFTALVTNLKYPELSLHAKSIWKADILESSPCWKFTSHSHKAPFSTWQAAFHRVTQGPRFLPQRTLLPVDGQRQRMWQRYTCFLNTLAQKWFWSLLLMFPLARWSDMTPPNMGVGAGKYSPC